MASSSSSLFSIPSLQSPPPCFLLLKSSFIGETTHLCRSCISPPHHHHHHRKYLQSYYYRSGLKMPSTSYTTSFGLKPTAKFNIFEIMGGRGLCNGEKNLQEELQKKTLQLVSDEEITSSSSSSANYNINEEENPPAAAAGITSTSSSSSSLLLEVPENAFEKELMGLTGGFPGGEEGLRSFIEKNPPPPKKSEGSSSSAAAGGVGLVPSSKSKPPELPILMPGMIAIVKNPENPFYMYCGIIQRITDGKAGVLFEGGNWDKIISFKLNELERRDKGPPMVNPKSAVFESQIQKQDSS